MTRARGWLPTLTCLALAQTDVPATAQIATDGTAGPGLKLNGPNYDIGDDLGTRAGRNLFHSFERFSLRSGEHATFRGPDAIRNVISRVTGGERSRINGTIASMMPNADFFFLNPAGVVFGPSAVLDVQGSFHVSTADELRFADGERLSAHPGDTSSFSVAAPEAFGFLGAGPAPITVHEGRLRVPAGEVLSIVGGDIDIAFAGLSAEAGQIVLSAVGGPGEARLGDGQVVADRRADITLRDSLLSTTGDGGGTIRIRGGAIVVEDATTVFADNSGPSDSQGGVDIDGHSLEVRGGAQLTADVFDTGRGGRVSVRADEVKFAAGSFLTANTSDQGNAGTVMVTARDLEIRGGARIGSSSSAAGKAGTVTVEVGQLRIFGDGSDQVTGIRSDANADSTETGDAGAVTVTAREIEIRSGGEIRSSTFGAGDAGTVKIDANRLLISGAEALRGADTGFPALTGISSSVGREATGVGGSVSVNADDLELRADGKIRTVTFSAGKAGTVTVAADRVTLRSGGQISSSALEEGTGESGDVALTADETLSVSGQSRFFDGDGNVFPPSGVFASTESLSPDAGAGGTVTVTAPVIRLADRAEISSEVFGGGAGGALDIRFTELLEVDDAEITTKANTVDAGDITIQGRDVIDVRNGGEISTTVFEEDSKGNAGDITIDPRFIILDGGRIQANGRRGQGGNIRITVDNLIQSPDSLIEALSQEGGIDGTVVISTPEADVSSGLVVLEGALLDAASQLRERCGARRDIGASSFTGVGRGGLPPGPDAPLAGAYLGRDAAGGAAREWAAMAPPKQARSASGTRVVAAVAPCVAWPEAAMGSP